MRPHLLIVEDDAVAATLLQDMALELGFRNAEVAGDMREAFDRLDTVHPDAMILDINLHGKKSYAVAARAAKLAIPFMFLSGYNRNDIPLEYLRVPVLAKPYSLEALRQALSELVPRPGGPGQTSPHS